MEVVFINFRLPEKIVACVFDLQPIGLSGFKAVQGDGKSFDIIKASIVLQAGIKVENLLEFPVKVFDLLFKLLTLRSSMNGQGLPAGVQFVGGGLGRCRLGGFDSGDSELTKLYMFMDMLFTVLFT